MAKKEGDYLKIKEVSPQLKDLIRNISRNMGVSMNAFVKMELRKSCDAYPDNMRKPPLKY